MQKRRTSTQYEGRAPKRVRTLDDSFKPNKESTPLAVRDIEMGWSPFRIIRVMENYKTVGKGYVEVARYELLFGFNNSGKNFQDGNYCGSEQDFDTFMDEFITEGNNTVKIPT